MSTNITPGSAVDLLRELIAIPSVNPAFLPPGDPCAGEHNVADFVAATAARNGLCVEFQPVEPKRSNILIHYLPKGKIRRRILLAPHLDTVGAPGSLEELFSPKLKNGRIHGRGACDTKGSAAAMLTSLMTVANSVARPSETQITFAGLMDEENGQAGSRAFGKSGMKADLAFVGEPTRLQLVTAHKGDLWLRAETQGKSAHGARPELGRNAIHAMAKVVELLETQYANDLRKRRHPLLGNPTVNVGSISGGTQPNIVPAFCWASIDRRTLPGETEASVLKEMNALLRKHKIKARILNSKNAECEPLETDSNLPLVREFLGILGQKKPVGVDFFCDAAVLAASGIPSVVFGPGDIAQAHTADEWVSVASLERATLLLTRFLQKMP